MGSISTTGPSSRMSGGGDPSFSLAATDGRPQVGMVDPAIAWSKTPIGTLPSKANSQMYDRVALNEKQKAGRLYASDTGNTFQDMMSLIWGVGAFCWTKVVLYQGGQDASPIQKIHSPDIVVRLMCFQDHTTLEILRPLMGFEDTATRFGNADSPYAPTCKLPKGQGPNGEWTEPTPREFMVPLPVFWGQSNSTVLDLDSVYGTLHVDVYWRDAEELVGWAGARPTIDVWNPHSSRTLNDGTKCSSAHNSLEDATKLDGTQEDLRIQRILGPAPNAMGAARCRTTSRDLPS